MENGQLVLDTSRLHASWASALSSDLASPRLRELTGEIDRYRRAGREIYPPAPSVLRALELTPLHTVRVVIIGQDPYHGPRQAHGLSFSVQPGITIPPSLRNIYKELQADLGIAPAPHGFLEHWALQGVLLLNNVLTVEHGAADSHKGLGWEELTDAIVREAARQPQPVVFILWGKNAQEKAASLPDVDRHLVIRSAHPSPMSATRGFFGSKPFSRANDFLVANGRGAIDWALPTNQPSLI